MRPIAPKTPQIPLCHSGHAYSFISYSRCPETLMAQALPRLSQVGTTLVPSAWLVLSGWPGTWVPSSRACGMTGTLTGMPRWRETRGLGSTPALALIGVHA